MTLRGQVVDLVRLHLLDDADQAGGIGEIAVMQHEAAVLGMRILVEMIDAVRVEQRGAAFHAVHFVALVQQEFREIGAVLAGHARNQGHFLAHALRVPEMVCGIVAAGNPSWRQAS